MSMMRFLLPALALMLNALVFGVSWWPFRALQEQGMHALWATAFMFFLATGGLTLVRPGAWRALARYPMLCVLLAASGLTHVGFNWAVTTGDVVRVVLLFYTMPAWALLLAWPLLGERPGAAALLRLVLALGGVVIVLKTPSSPWPLPDSLADWLALAGGFCFALTNVLLRLLYATPNDARMLAMFAGGALMAAVSALLGMEIGVVGAPPAHVGSWVTIATALGLALMVGNAALQYGAARLSAGTTALIMLTEVVFASISSVLLGAAELTARSLIGGGLIVLASLLSVHSSANAQRPAAPP